MQPGRYQTFSIGGDDGIPYILSLLFSPLRLHLHRDRGNISLWYCLWSGALDDCGDRRISVCASVYPDHWISSHVTSLHVLNCFTQVEIFLLC